MVERFDYVRINDLAEQAIPNGKYECLVCKKKLAALQASHEDLVKALTVMLERCALVYTHPTLDPEFMKARKALANAAPAVRGER